MKKPTKELITQTNTLEIIDQSSLKEATSLLSKLNKYLDSIIEYKEKKTKPLNQALKVIRAETKPYETEITSLIASIRLKMTEYQTNLVEHRKETEQLITSRIAPGKGNLTLETAVKQLESLPTIEKETATDDGLVQFREKKQLKITDLTLIPEEYWHINDDLLLKDLKDGLIIPGAELETIQVPVNYR